MAKVAVVIPVLNRPSRVKPLVEAFKASCSPEQATLYIVAQTNDKAELEEIVRCADTHPEVFNGVGIIVVSPDKQSWAKKVNESLSQTEEPWLFLGGDDLDFKPGWFEKLDPYLESEFSVIGTRDGHNDSTLSTAHPVVRRDYAEKLGTIDEPGKVVHDGYHHNFPDTELVATAMMRGRYKLALDVVIEHLHPLYGKAKLDDTYRLGQVNFGKDKALYNERSKKFGFRL